MPIFRDTIGSRRAGLLQMGQAMATPARKTRIVPVVEEKLRVDKKVATRTVRVLKRVRERVARVDEPLAHEEVVVERVPVGRFVDAPIPDRHEGDTLVISVLEEVPVVRLRLKEEIRITRKRTRSRHKETVVLRSEDVQVERKT
jgi:stress response protein YsnF